MPIAMYTFQFVHIPILTCTYTTSRIFADIYVPACYTVYLQTTPCLSCLNEVLLFAKLGPLDLSGGHQISDWCSHVCLINSVWNLLGDCKATCAWLAAKSFSAKELFSYQERFCTLSLSCDQKLHALLTFPVEVEELSQFKCWPFKQKHNLWSYSVGWEIW